MVGGVYPLSTMCKMAMMLREDVVATGFVLLSLPKRFVAQKCNGVGS